MKAITSTQSLHIALCCNCYKLIHGVLVMIDGLALRGNKLFHKKQFATWKSGTKDFVSEHRTEVIISIDS